MLSIYTWLEDKVLFSVFHQVPIIKGHLSLNEILYRVGCVLILCPSPVELGVLKEAKTV
jgi:hypothetical protein